MLVKASNFTASELQRFLDLQALSFDILEETAAGLNGGETEKEVARELVRRYRRAGASSFFHLPVALFGERTALPGQWSVGKFFPKRKSLEPGDSVILDAAPFIDGYLVDTSYSFCFGESEAHRDMMEHLSQYRESVLEAVNRGDSFLQIAEAVRQSMNAAGYEAAHNKHPGEVLGHRTVKTPGLALRPRIQGFDALSLAWFKMKDGMAGTGLGRRSPLWNESKVSDHAPHDGLWLVEPHAGSGETGAKWEEILVIEDGKAHWLQDDPPHVRQWASIANGDAYQPRQLEPA